MDLLIVLFALSLQYCSAGKGTTQYSPDPPLNVKAVKATVHGTTILVSWRHPDYDVSSYKVFYMWTMMESVVARSLWPHVEVTGLFDRVYIEGLETTWDYAVSVKAVARNGSDSEFSDVVYSEKYVGPYKVRALDLRQETSTSVQVTWQEPRAEVTVVKYVLSYKKEDSNTEDVFLPGYHRSYTLTDLKPLENYEISIKAKFMNGFKGRPTKKFIRLSDMGY